MGVVLFLFFFWFVMWVVLLLYYGVGYVGGDVDLGIFIGGLWWSWGICY